MKKVLILIIIPTALVVLLYNVNIILAADTFQGGLNKSAEGMGYEVVKDKPENAIYSKIGQVLNISTVFLGVVFLCLMIYAGYLWMMARGNEQEVAKAKSIIIYAVIGLVVVLAAYAITKLVYNIWLQSITIQKE